ncbi:unnamed protein product [Didymodactylos carnosus]|uniref:Uncharacterized protein n=1 Tax=Didymodactylos carnosus TaxID=1234261 RepID=A0A8S2F9I5_9BILA|nr:unnamed protein product [Didymodactylos carnosus]CAF4194534.1 unnamed protein product [Didymodactylos carnosus]
MTQNIGDIMKLCRETCNIRYLSTLLYMSMRHFNIPTTVLDVFMSSIGAYNRKTSHKWPDVFLNQSLDEFLLDRLGGKQGDGFYDLYPEIEIEARTFAVEACGRKAASLTVQELAEFIDSKFYELYDLKKTSTGLIRSVESVRLDMRKWGINYSADGLRPYFIGHERQDVIEHRGKIIDYFLAREKMYYRLTDDDQPEWIKPTSPNPVILINLEDDEGLRYEKNSATASIAIGTGTYFDNDTILSQFERLFKLLQFKMDYKGHDIEILVDNATTHSKKDYSISDFSKKIGTRCEVQSIDWLDDNNDFHTLNCFFTSGQYSGKNVRKHSEQSFPKMIELVEEARQHFQDKKIDRKLQRRFWRTLHAYNDGQDYKQVHCMFFSTLSKPNLISHRKITNSNLDSS